MKAVILAAGTGTRLGPLTQDIPKCLIPVAGRPLIDRMIERMSAVVIDELVVVAGFRHEVLERHLRASDAPLARDARVIVNQRYHDLGNCYSLLVARQAVEGSDFIKCDGDVVLPADILPRLLDTSGNTVLVVDRGVVLGQEEMKVRVDEAGRVIQLNKRMEPSHAIGEYIGLERIGASVGPAIFDELESMLESGEGHEYYERAYERLMAKGTHFAYIEVGSGTWCEIDTAEDLDHAHQVIARQRPRNRV
jgi:choline kinase